MLANNEMQKLYMKLNALSGTLGPDGFVDAQVGSASQVRRKIINWFALILSIIVAVRLVYINVGIDDFLSKQLDIRVMRTIKLDSTRGAITDRNGNPLAISTPVSSIWADPRELTQLTSLQLNSLAKVLEIPLSELNDKLNDKRKTFVYLKRAVSPDLATQINALNIEGIHDLQEYKRYYPNGEVSAHLVGFTNIDDMGADGVEYATNNQLIGHDGSQKIMRDRQGATVENIGVTKPMANGKSVELSIDNRIQFIAYNALKAQVDKSQAKGGSAIVLDAKTGEVLAMVNMPTYNPNNRENVTPDMLKNRAATNVYDPGSIIKPLVIAKALDDGVVNPSTVFDTHSYKVGPKLIVDDHPYPSLTVKQIIERSSDIGTSKIAMKYKAKDLWTYYRSIGFGQKLGTGFPGETNGILRDWKKWYPVDHALMSYGYGISVSLFQMAHAYSVFTNNGCILPVTFYKSATGAKPVCEQVISPQVAETMRVILSDVVTDGTGKSAQVANYTVAGKTGTAQKLDGATYSNKKHVGSFVGFAPAINPRIIIAVMIDEVGKGGYHGSATAAPVFSQIAGQTLQMMNVTPDKLVLANKNSVASK